MLDLSETSVIILEDNPGDYFILEHLLSDLGVKSESISWFQKLSDFVYEQESFIFCDLSHPDSEGLDTVKSVSNHIKSASPILIVLTGSDDEQKAQESIQLGAQDYLVKGTFGLTFLKKTMLFSSERIKLIQDLQFEKERTQKAERSLSTILSSVPSVIIMFDNHNSILYINKGIGADSDTSSIITHNLFEFVHPDFRDEASKSIHELKSNRTKVSGQLKAVDSQGVIYDLVFEAVPLDKYSYVLVASDITDLLKVNQELVEESDRSKIAQLKLLSSQLNPHFVFNAMSSIQHSVLFNSAEISLNIISNFSSVIRGVLENSRKELIDWKEEKNFLIKYLELEQFRFENKFDFNFIDSEIGESFYLPPMLIQPYVENAVIHGVGNLKDKKGEIRVSLSVDGESVIITVRDNGVGRKKAADLRNLRIGGHISRAMTISTQRLDLLNSFLDKDAYFVQVGDLFNNDGSSAGTEVKIYLPAESRL